MKSFLTILLEGINEGEAGYWQQEGYTIENTPIHQTSLRFFAGRANGPMFHVIAKDKNGKEVGRLEVEPANPDDCPDNKPHVQAAHVKLDQTAQRKGLANAMYSYAERIGGMTFVPGQFMLPKAHMLWAQPNRPFATDYTDTKGRIKPNQYKDPKNPV